MALLLLGSEFWRSAEPCLFLRSRAWFSNFLSATRLSVHELVAFSLNSSKASPSFLIASTACTRTALHTLTEPDCCCRIRYAHWLQARSAQVGARPRKSVLQLCSLSTSGNAWSRESFMLPRDEKACDAL